MITKTFQVKRESLNIHEEAHVSECCKREADNISVAVKEWISEQLPSLIVVDPEGKSEFDIKVIVELKDGV